MTATLHPAQKTTADHPLTPLSADEIRAARRIVDAAGLLGENVRFVFVALEEPHKSEVLAFSRTSSTPLLFHGGRYRRLHSDEEIETPPNIDVWLHGW